MTSLDSGGPGLPPAPSGVSIIIPVFNKVDLTRQFLQSFLRWPPPSGIAFEVIVADNASTDATKAFLTEFQASHPWLSHVTLEHNGGYGQACNAGAARAAYSHLLFLNNDMVVLERWLEPLVSAFTDENVGIAGSRLVYPNYTIQHAGIVFPENRLPVHPFRELPYNAAEVSGAREYAAVTGACLMIPKALFAEIGGFDRVYKMYYEDIDLCLKVRARKKSILYVPESMLIHLEGKSSGSFSEMSAKSAESMPIFLTKWGSFLSKALREEPELYGAGLAYPAAAAESGLSPFERQALKDAVATILYCVKNQAFLFAFDYLLRNQNRLTRCGDDPLLKGARAQLEKSYAAFLASQGASGEAGNPAKGPALPPTQAFTSGKALDVMRSPALFAQGGAVPHARAGRPMRVLFQNRANAFTMPGGDTIVMNRLKERLVALGVQVDFCPDPFLESIAGYDLIHLFNLTLPAVTEAFAKNAVAKNIPFVVTTLQEDFPRYYHKANKAFSWFRDYVTGDDELRSALGPLSAAYAAAAPIPLVTSPFAARAANLLFACGETEGAFLQSSFPGARVTVTPFGSSVKEIAAPPALFEETFGVKDFVLCVGRLEIRKNQLMLLKALEDSDLPLVFADGGFAYLPEYQCLCKIYKRKGRTIFTGRLSDEMLVSAYRACRLHCLPSWFELPGLVSLEAARYGCPVVAGSWGGLPDYLGDACTYCAPDDSESIRGAVESVYERGERNGAAETAGLFAWEKFGRLTLAHYERVIAEHTRFAPGHVAEAEEFLSVVTLPTFINGITQLTEKGNFAEALKFYDEGRKSLTEQSPDLARVDALMGVLRSKLQGVKNA